MSFCENAFHYTHTHTHTFCTLYLTPFICCGIPLRKQLTLLIYKRPFLFLTIFNCRVCDLALLNSHPFHNIVSLHTHTLACTLLLTHTHTHAYAGTHFLYLILGTSLATLSLTHTSRQIISPTVTHTPSQFLLCLIDTSLTYTHLLSLI